MPEKMSRHDISIALEPAFDIPASAMIDPPRISGNVSTRGRTKLPRWMAAGNLDSATRLQKRSSSGSGSNVPLGKRDRMNPRSPSDSAVSTSAMASSTPVTGTTAIPLRRPSLCSQKPAIHSLYVRTHASWRSRSSA